MKCEICGEGVDACDMCTYTFKQGDLIYCYEGEHFCSPECVVEAVGAASSEVVE